MFSSHYDQGADHEGGPLSSERLGPNCSQDIHPELKELVPELSSKRLEEAAGILFDPEDPAQRILSDRCLGRDNSPKTSLTLAAAPGRVCLGGESLDWMNGGPSIVGAVDVWLYGAVERLPGEAPFLEFIAGPPLYMGKRTNLDQLGQFKRDPLDLPLAAAKLLADKKLLTGPVRVRTGGNLPARAGVSSSAAASLVAVAGLARHVGLDLTKKDVCAEAFRIEDVELATGAGQMDFYACGLGGLHYLVCGPQPPCPIVRYDIPDLAVVMVDTLKKHCTKDYISEKHQRYQERDPLILEYMEKMPAIVEQMGSLMDSFQGNAEEIGSLITRCHGFLKKNLLISTELLDQCVDLCLTNGAFGAKLSGTGLGGCMFAISKQEHLPKMISELEQLPVKVYSTRFVPEGVQVSSL